LFVVPYFANFWILCIFENFSLCLVFWIFTIFENSRSGWFLFCLVSRLTQERKKERKVWQELNLQPNSLAKTPLFAHTQTSDHRQFTPQPYSPHSHPSTPYQLRPAPTSRTFHPTHTPSMKFFFMSVPQIFLSEFVQIPVRESALRECEFPTLALYQ